MGIRPIRLILFIAFVVFLVGSMNYYAVQKSLNRSIIGKITKVEYSTKGSTVISIDSKEFPLGAFYLRERDSIFVGDSIFKKKGDMNLYHFKKNWHSEYELYKTHVLHY